MQRFTTAIPSACHARLLTIVVMPTFGAGGTPIPGQYDGYLGTRLLVCGSRQPFLDSCRELLRLGFDPAATAVMQRIGSATESLRSRIGAAAKLTVKGPDRGRPTFAAWEPYCSSPVEPPAAQTAPAYAEGEDAYNGASPEVVS